MMAVSWRMAGEDEDEAVSLVAEGLVRSACGEPPIIPENGT